jgi:hypothetical protein
VGCTREPCMYRRRTRYGFADPGLDALLIPATNGKQDTGKASRDEQQLRGKATRSLLSMRSLSMRSLSIRSLSMRSLLMRKAWFIRSFFL